MNNVALCGNCAMQRLKRLLLVLYLLPGPGHLSTGARSRLPQAVKRLCGELILLDEYPVAIS